MAVAIRARTNEEVFKFIVCNVLRHCANMFGREGSLFRGSSRVEPRDYILVPMSVLDMGREFFVLILCEQ